MMNDETEVKDEAADAATAVPAETIPAPVAGESPLEKILEALLLASELPLPLDNLHRVLGRELGASRKDVREALDRLAASLEGRAVELREVASGWRIQVRKDYAEWVSRLWQEKPPKLSRALMETLAIICYRQPATRGEIEEIRGVALSPNIIRTLIERGWIREVGVKEVPGRPALFGTTHQLLDDLGLKSLDELPSLPEIKDPDQLEAALTRLGANALPAAEEAAAPESASDESPEPTEDPPAGEATLH
jgi:segregation and condensation protein B